MSEGDTGHEEIVSHMGHGQGPADWETRTAAAILIDNVNEYLVSLPYSKQIMGYTHIIDALYHPYRSSADW